MSKLFFVSPTINNVIVTKPGEEPVVLFKHKGCWIDYDGDYYLNDLIPGASYVATFDDEEMWMTFRLDGDDLVVQTVQSADSRERITRQWTGKFTPRLLSDLVSPDGPFLPIWDRQPRLGVELTVAGFVQKPGSLKSAEAAEETLCHTEVEVNQYLYAIRDEHAEEVKTLKARVRDLEQQIADSVPF